MIATALEVGEEPEFFKKYVRNTTEASESYDCCSNSSRRDSIVTTHDIIGKHLRAFYRPNQCVQSEI